MLRWLLALIAILSALDGTMATAAPSEHEVKAAFVLKFADYVRWPGKPANAQITIGLVGRNNLESAVRRLLAEEPAAAKRFRIINIQPTDVPALQQCDVIFIGSIESHAITGVLSAVASHPILTVSDAPNFRSSGGIIELLLRDSRVRFTVNTEAATSSRLALEKSLVLQSLR